MRATALLCLIMMFGCGRSDGAADLSREDAGGLLPAGPVELELSAGAEQAVEGTALRIRFVGVTEDSRCPTDVTCVWEGNAAAELAATAGSGSPEPLVLNTTLDPRSTLWNGLRITLVEVSPHPVEGQAIPAEDYVVRVRVASEGG